jgi:hypothetical protein
LAEVAGVTDDSTTSVENDEKRDNNVTTNNQNVLIFLVMFQEMKKQTHVSSIVKSKKRTPSEIRNAVEVVSLAHSLWGLHRK